MMQGLADNVLPKDRAEGCLAVAAAGKWGSAGAFELNVPPASGWIQDLPQQEGPAVP